MSNKDAALQRVADKEAELLEKKKQFLAKTATPLVIVNWESSVSEEDKTGLKAIAKSITEWTEKANMAFMGIGERLLEAREFFPGDKEFGQWRADLTPFSQSQAERFMRVVKQFSGKSIADKAGHSLLLELTTASPEVVEKVEADLDAGKKVTREQVRNAKKANKVTEGKADSETKKEAEDRKKKKQEAANELTASQKAMERRRKVPEGSQSTPYVIESFIKLSLEERIERHVEMGMDLNTLNAHMLLGLAVGDVSHNADTIEIIGDTLHDNLLPGDKVIQYQSVIAAAIQLLLEEAE